MKIMKKVLITGATGFVGNHVVKELLKYNFEVLVAAQDVEQCKSFAWFDKVKIFQFDLEEKNENYFQYFQEPDLMIHLAWFGLPNYKELFHIEKNLYQNYFFVKNMMMNGLKNISVIGTCFEYGMQNGCLREDMETMPNNSYALAKDTLRKFMEELNKKYQIDFKWIRLFYLFGEGQNKNSILEQLKTAIRNNEKAFNMSGGEQLRDYLPIEKVAKYIVKISLQNKVHGIFNCCSGKPISVKSLVENFLKENNSEIDLNLGYYPYSDYEPMAFWGDNSKMLDILNEKQDNK